MAWGQTVNLHPAKRGFSSYKQQAEHLGDKNMNDFKDYRLIGCRAFTLVKRKSGKSNLFRDYLNLKLIQSEMVRHMVTLDPHLNLSDMLDSFKKVKISSPVFDNLNNAGYGFAKQGRITDTMIMIEASKAPGFNLEASPSLKK